MRKLVVLLAFTTATFAASTLYLLVERSRPVFSELPAPSPAMASAPAPGAAESIATSKHFLAAPAPAPAENFAPTPGPADPLQQMGAENRQFLERAIDPLQRQQLLEETKVNVRQRYPALDRLLGLDANGYDRLLELLANQFIEMRKTSLQCKYESTCGTRLPQLRETQQLELAALLGPDGQQRFDDYVQTRQERLSVNSLRGRLTDKNRLADAQAEVLVLALANERKRVADELVQRGETETMAFEGVPFRYSPGTTYDELMEQAQAYQARLRKRAAEVLMLPQLAVYDQMIAEKLIIVRAMARSTIDMQAKVVPAGPSRPCIRPLYMRQWLVPAYNAERSAPTSSTPCVRRARWWHAPSRAPAGTAPSRRCGPPARAHRPAGSRCARTKSTLRSISSTSQPSECAMNGNCGTRKPISLKNIIICPATAWMPSWPPVMMNAATLLRISTLLLSVIWFWMQFMRSTIL